MKSISKTHIEAVLQILSKLLKISSIEITSWLVSAYDFYSRVVKDR